MQHLKHNNNFKQQKIEWVLIHLLTDVVSVAADVVVPAQCVCKLGFGGTTEGSVHHTICLRGLESETRKTMQVERGSRHNGISVLQGSHTFSRANFKDAEHIHQLGNH